MSKQRKSLSETCPTLAERERKGERRSQKETNVVLPLLLSSALPCVCPSEFRRSLRLSIASSCQESTRGCGLPNGIPIDIEAGAKYSVTSLQYSATSHLFSSKTTCNPVFGQCNNACKFQRKNSGQLKVGELASLALLGTVRVPWDAILFLYIWLSLASRKRHGM